MKRILFFVHYNKYDGLSDHVLYLLQHIKHIYTRIVFISNSPIDEEQNKRLDGLYNKIILRENKGFDFGAWRDAILEEGWDEVAEYDNLTIMNDTCFGPLYDMEPIYLEMEQKDIDFWGMTNHRQSERGMPGTNGPVPEHIQSFFISFNKNVVVSKSFRSFWCNVKYHKNVNNVIRKYETQFTLKLLTAGFKYYVFFNTLNIKHYHFNLANLQPDLCLNNKLPLVKIKSFTCFQYPKYVIKLIQEKSNYPVSLIYDYFNEVYDPNTSLFIEDKLITAQEKQIEISYNEKIAIHLHVFYLDIFEKYVSIFDTFNINIDLFITTDSAEKKEQILNYVKNHICFKNIKEILVFENRGRDILPWLLIADKLNSYDIAGHFHTKKTVGADEWIGITWQNEIFDLLLKSIGNIIDTFKSNNKIGIIIPQIPYCFHILDPIKYSEDKNMKYMMKEFWNKLNCKKQINFDKLSTLLFPRGTMFWYKPKALEKLFNLKLKSDDIQVEPISSKCTLLHCIERMLVYISWNMGYDYRIMVPEKQITSNFEDNSIFNTKILNSKDYKLGKFILTIPRLCKKSEVTK
ncbi:MAG: rhamnan synthesis F family protein [Termitinemataceae bacterium]|nr:MAG: rhamnan synthesis F family protein [Termitinemataceae bacterium]